LGNLTVLYRLFHDIFAISSFYLFLIAAPHRDIIIYDLSNQFDFIILIPQFLALIGIAGQFNFPVLVDFPVLPRLKAIR
jgi:hypothetical protein